MPKLVTLTALAALLLGTTSLHVTPAMAMQLSLGTVNQAENAAAAPAEQAFDTSTPTINSGDSSSRPSSESFDEARAEASGKPEYFIGIHVKHKKPAKPGLAPKLQSARDLPGLGKVKRNVASLGALHNPAAIGGTAPQPATGTGHGTGKGKGETVPGFGYGKSGFGKGATLPGTGSGKGVRSVPGFDDIGNGPDLNLPGGQKKGAPGDAAKYLAAQENAAVASLLDAAARGPDVNIPNDPAPGQTQADGILDTVISFVTGKDAEKAAAGVGEKGNGASAQTKLPERAPINRVISWTEDKKGRIIQLFDVEYTDNGEHYSGMTVGPITVVGSRGGSKKTPNDADTSSPVNGSSDLALNNPYSGRNYAGGTDNNVEQAGLVSTDVAPNSSLAQKEFGGGGNDAGENHLTSAGALAADSVLTRKDQGDGGNSDTRGGDKSDVHGKIKVKGPPTNGQLVAANAAIR